MIQFAQITDLHLDDMDAALKHIDTRNNISIILDDISKNCISKLIITGDTSEPSATKWLIDLLDSYTSFP